MFKWVNFLSYVLATAAVPGANIIMSMSNAGHFGFKKAVPFNFGIWAGFSIVSLACTLFCNTLSSIIPKIEFPMRMVAAIYLLWLAYKTVKSVSKTEDDRIRKGFFSGFMLQFVNPKIYIYCIVSMGAYVLPFFQGQWEVLVFFSLLLAFIGFISTICWTLFASVFKNFFLKYAKITNTVFALLLVYCAVSLFFT